MLVSTVHFGDSVNSQNRQYGPMDRNPFRELKSLRKAARALTTNNFTNASDKRVELYAKGYWESKAGHSIISIKCQVLHIHNAWITAIVDHEPTRIRPDFSARVEIHIVER